MYKKIISVMSVALVVFLCSSPVFATAVPTGTAKQAVADYAIDDYTRALRYETYVTALQPVLVESSFDASNATINVPNFYTTSGSGHIDNPNTHPNASYLYYYDPTTNYHWVNGSGSSTTGSGQLTFSGGSTTTVIRYDFIYTIMLSNYYKQAIALGDQWVGANFDFTLPSGVTVAGMEINMIAENNLTFLQPSTNGTMWFTAPTESIIDRKTIIPNGATYSCNMCVSIYGTTSGGYVSTMPTYNALSLRSISSVTPWDGIVPSVIYQLSDLNAKLQEFLDNYAANVPASDNLTDQSQDVTNTIDNQHQQEASYFEDTQDAIENTGIRNFQFDAQSISGLHGIRDDFDAVFLSLGNLKSYFIASLTIGLALSIIRHRRMFEK